jgi:hypothetical protein
MQHLRECLVSRFDPASSSVNARFELDKLKQSGKFSNLNHYLTKFDRICSYVPDMQDAEKIHRFLSGLTNEVFMRQLTVDPMTKERYTDFAALRHAASHVAVPFAAMHNLAAGFLPKLSGQKRNGDSTPKTQGNPKRSNGGKRSAGAGSSGLNGNNSKPPPKDLEIRTGNGTIIRDSDVVGFCNGRKICINYYGPHKTATCTKPMNTTLPTDAVLDPTAAPADKQAGPSDCDNTAPHAHPVGIEHSAPAHNNSPSDPQLLCLQRMTRGPTDWTDPCAGLIQISMTN